jgi:hypothetical protein
MFEVKRPSSVRVWIAGAVFALVLAGSAGLDEGVHYSYAMRYGVATPATLEFVMSPPSSVTGRPNLGGPTAMINYQRGKDDAPTVSVPVSYKFYLKYKDRTDAPLGLHIIRGGFWRPIIDEDPPSNPWFWPIAILIAAAAAAAIAFWARRDFEETEA